MYLETKKNFNSVIWIRLRGKKNKIEVFVYKPKV